MALSGLSAVMGDVSGVSREAGPTSADINTGFCTVVEEQNRHTGHGLIILGVADAKTLKISNGNLSDRVE